MNRLRLAELCAATSLFTDLGTGQPVEHGLRTCLVSMRLADALNLDDQARTEVFYVSLLRFLGCTADSYLVGQAFGGNDIGFLSGMAPMTMGSTREEMMGLLRLASEAGAVSKTLRVIADLGSAPKKGDFLEAHCEVASRLADDMTLPRNVSKALEAAYARWDGKGVPALAGHSIPVSIRISVVARDLEMWGREAGSDVAAATLKTRRGHAYDPRIVDAALDLGVEILRGCDDSLWDVVLDLEPEPHIRLHDGEVPQALQALGDFADLKTPEFTGHSRRVRDIAAAAAEAAGLSSEDIDTLGCAGSVHDLGVVATPAGVWLDAGGISPAEEEQARLHPLWSQRLLGRVAGLGNVASMAGSHHERLDGTGYPAGIDRDLGSAGLLVCAELYDESLRKARSAEKVVEEMTAMARSGRLAASDVGSVLDAVGARHGLIEVPRPAGLTEREVDVLGLLARGRTNRQIATDLGISVKTVGSHVEHLYVKAGVRTRAAATLFAIRNNLV